MSTGLKRNNYLTFWIFAIICITAVMPLYAQTLNTAAGQVTWQASSTYLNEVTLVRGGTTHGDGYDGAMSVSVSGSGVSYSMDYTFSSTYGVAIQEVAVSNTSGGVATYNISCQAILVLTAVPTGIMHPHQVIIIRSVQTNLLPLLMDRTRSYPSCTETHHWMSIRPACLTPTITITTASQFRVYR